MDTIIGKHSYGGITAIGGTKGKITVGKYCSFGENVRAFMSHDHNIDSIATYPFGHANRRVRRLEVKIGNDVFIGSHSVIFREVTIGDGAVIGAFSTITKDVPPYTVVVGNDRVLRKRFSDEDIDFLLKLKWWDLPDEKVAEITPILCSSDVTALRKMYG